MKLGTQHTRYLLPCAVAICVVFFFKSPAALVTSEERRLDHRHPIASPAPLCEPKVVPTAAPDEPPFIAYSPVEFLHRNLSLTDFIENDERVTVNAAALCELFLLSNDRCRMDEGRETMRDCIARYGVEAWTYALPRRCTESDYWQRLRRDVALQRRPTVTVQEALEQSRELRDFVFKAQVQDPSEPYPDMLPSSKRYLTPFAHTECPKGGIVVATGFGYPARMIRAKLAKTKVFDWGLVLPGLVLRGNHLRRQHPLWYHDEPFLYATHRHAFFSFSHYRGGWDCMRHVDILSQGTVPYIVDIEKCGAKCLSGYPKKLIIEAMEMDGVAHVGRLHHGVNESGNEFWRKEADRKWVDFHAPGKIDRSRFNVTKYRELANKMMDYTQKYLWCGSVVASLLHSMGIDEPRNVLFIRYPKTDFQSFAIDCGLAELGINYTSHTLPDPPPAAWERISEASLANASAAAIDEAKLKRGVESWYIRGAVYGFRLRAPRYPLLDRKEMVDRIKHREFDAVIFTSINTFEDDWSLLDIAVKSVDFPRRVALVDGSDRVDEAVHSRIRHVLSLGALMAVRELQDVPESC